VGGCGCGPGDVAGDMVVVVVVGVVIGDGGCGGCGLVVAIRRRCLVVHVPYT
jgi:hypothetical protein